MLHIRFRNTWQFHDHIYYYYYYVSLKNTFVLQFFYNHVPCHNHWAKVGQRIGFVFFPLNYTNIIIYKELKWTIFFRRMLNVLVRTIFVFISWRDGAPWFLFISSFFIIAKAPTTTRIFSDSLFSVSIARFFYFIIFTKK